jgi:hypothetical protein
MYSREDYLDPEAPAPSRRQTAPTLNKTMITPIFALQTRDGAWLLTDSGNVWKTDSRDVADAAAEKLRVSGGVGVSVDRYDLQLVSKETLAERLERAEKVLKNLAETSWTDTQDGSGDDLKCYRAFVKMEAENALNRLALPV